MGKKHRKVKIPEGVTYCKNCKQMVPHSLYCINCGKKLGEEK